MQQPAPLAVALAALLTALPAADAAMYSKNSGVLQLDAHSYSRLVANSNYTSIVEFYAPWCGHCQNLKPAYERAAKNLEGLAKVAAVDCDEESNKQFCGSMGVQGFPTLKIVRPSKKAGAKPVVEDYQGPRTAKAIIDTVADKINNHVTRLTDKDVDAFLAGDKPKFVLFTDKGTTSALLRSIAIDYLDIMSVGQIRNKEKAAVDKFGVEKFPTLLLFPGTAKDEKPITYEGELNKKSLLEFLSQAGPPNPDPAPTAANGDKTKGEKVKNEKAKTGKATKANTKASETEPSSESTEPTSSKVSTPTPEAIAITAIEDRDTLVEKCLQPKSYTCVLALVPPDASQSGSKVVDSLSQLNSKYIHGKRHLFPFYSVPSSVQGTSSLRDALKLASDVELIVINARRGWWKRYEGDFGVESVEGWIDEIRMGEGKKVELPKGVVVDQAEESGKKSSTEASKADEATQATDPEAETKTTHSSATEKVLHEEL